MKKIFKFFIPFLVIFSILTFSVSAASAEISNIDSEVLKNNPVLLNDSIFPSTVISNIPYTPGLIYSYQIGNSAPFNVNLPQCCSNDNFQISVIPYTQSKTGFFCSDILLNGYDLTSNFKQYGGTDDYFISFYPWISPSKYNMTYYYSNVQNFGVELSWNVNDKINDEYINLTVSLECPSTSYIRYFIGPVDSSSRSYTVNPKGNGVFTLDVNLTNAEYKRGYISFNNVDDKKLDSPDITIRRLSFSNFNLSPLDQSFSPDPSIGYVDHSIKTEEDGFNNAINGQVIMPDGSSISVENGAKNSIIKITGFLTGGLSKFGKSLSACSRMFNDFTGKYVPDFNTLLFISLSIGVFPLLVGITVNIRNKFK